MPVTAGVPRAAGLLLGAAADVVVRDPARWHPVAGFGAAASWLERRSWRPSVAAGGLHVALAVTPAALLAGVVDRRLRRPVPRLLWVAVLTWSVLGASGLRRAAREVEQAVAAGDLEPARARLRWLCGRDPSALDPDGLRRAVVESVAENTADAAVAPLLWGALAGPAGLVAYRAVNTLDAMIGHRNERYDRFGRVAARVDDLANLAPARVTALLAAALAPASHGSPAAALRAWRRDAGAHPSPNAGVCESAFAGALGLRLGGPTRYAYGTSARPWMGEGRPPTAGDVAAAVALSRAVVAAAALLGAAVALGCGARGTS